MLISACQCNIPSRKYSIPVKSYSRQSTACDTVSFGGLFGKSQSELFVKALKQAHYFDAQDFKNTKITQVKEMEIGDSKKNPVKAFLAHIQYGGSEFCNALAVFNSKNRLLGDIQNLDREEWNNGRPHPPVGKYLRLHNLNTSYLEGYKGVGAALIQESKAESLRLGFGGQLCVYAFNVFRAAKGSPVPFYAKMGFIDVRRPFATKEELILEYSKKDAVTNPMFMYLLSPEKIASLRNGGNVQ